MPGPAGVTRAILSALELIAPNGASRGSLGFARRGVGLSWMRLAKRLASFASIGALATAIQYLILVAGVQLAHASPVAASTLGFFISALANYALNRRYTFGSRKPHAEAAAKFLTVAVIGLGLNAVLLAAATEVLGLNYLVGQVLATLGVLIWNYSANAGWTFAAR
jgi:putative flippase GtrA